LLVISPQHWQRVSFIESRYILGNTDRYSYAFLFGLHVINTFMYIQSCHGGSGKRTWIIYRPRPIFEIKLQYNQIIQLVMK